MTTPALAEWFKEAENWLDEDLSYWVKDGAAIYQVGGLVKNGEFKVVDADDSEGGDIVVMVPISLPLTPELRESLKVAQE